MNTEALEYLKDILPRPEDIPIVDAPETSPIRDFGDEDEKIGELMKNAPEPLKALVEYYNSISVIKQPLFALVSSIAAAGGGGGWTLPLHTPIFLGNCKNFC